SASESWVRSNTCQPIATETICVAVTAKKREKRYCPSDVPRKAPKAPAGGAAVGPASVGDSALEPGVAFGGDPMEAPIVGSTRGRHKARSGRAARSAAPLVTLLQLVTVQRPALEHPQLAVGREGDRVGLVLAQRRMAEERAVERDDEELVLAEER